MRIARLIRIATLARTENETVDQQTSCEMGVSE